ncbi:MAG: hypothetical protein LBS34_00865 [Rickettsiales bacterium]|nr:hypothetical protein [Rickettsiales bacterium]
MYATSILMFGVVVSAIISFFSIKLKLCSHQSEFLFLQFGFYGILAQKIIISFGENIYLAFQFLIPYNNLNPTIDLLYVENNNIYENSLMCNILNLSFGIVSCMIKNQCLFIHSMGDLFFSPNQLYFLNIETQRVHDDSLL